MNEAFGGFPRVDLDEVRHLQRSLDRLETIPQLAGYARTRGFTGRLASYGSYLRRLYGAVGRVSGASVVVDSSKTPSHAFALSALPGFRVHVVHLVRDSRAVAFSWTRERLRPEIHWRRQSVPQLPPLQSALEWNLTNTAAHALSRVTPGYLLVRYEDLVLDPRGILGTVLEFLGRERRPLPFIQDGTVHLGANHTVSGNLARFRSGRVPVRPDTEWERRMNRRHRAVVTATTWPLLAAYGYLRPGTSLRPGNRNQGAKTRPDAAG